MKISIEFLRKKQTRYILLIFIVMVFAAFLRIYKLGSIPDGLYCDEAANGYTSFCILKTGSDMFGTRFPLIINHHNLDFTEPLYVYLSIPFIALFNLSVFSARLPAAVAGTLMILPVFFLAKELFGKNTALLAAVFLSVSPWEMQFSRIAFRAVLSPLFITSGVFFFLRAFRRPSSLILSAAAFGLSVNSYTAAKISVPVSLLAVFLIYRREILLNFSQNPKFRRYSYVSAVGFLLLASFSYLFFPVYISPRKDLMSVFSSGKNPALLFAVNFFKHLSPGFLFTSGDANLRHSIPGFGQCLRTTALFLVPGIIFAFRGHGRKLALLFSLFLSGIIPAALTNESIPHALRAIDCVPYIEIIASYGAYVIFKYLFVKKSIRLKLLGAAVAALFIFDAGSFIRGYFVRYPVYSYDAFQGPFIQALKYAKSVSKNYEYIVISDKTMTSYIFPLFYDRIIPGKPREANKVKYIVSGKDIEKIFAALKGKALFVVTADELPGKKPLYCVMKRNNEYEIKVLGRRY